MYEWRYQTHLFNVLRMMFALSTGIGRIIGARTQITYTHFGGAALDVDHDENLDVMEQMHDDWMAHQRALRNRHP